MCGISGLVNVTEDVMVMGLIKPLLHRGPDGQDIVTKNNVTFCHTRLSVIGDDRYTQPVELDGRMLTINGEIYNYQDFAMPGNDSYAFFRLIKAKGLRQALDQANGMFAFAYYDGEKVFMAVDRLGQKPLYYYHDGKTLVFASTPNALLWLKKDWKINQTALNSYWLLGGIMGENSLFDGIKRLNAAELATFDPETGELSIERYWEPKFQENTSGIEDLVLDSIRKVKVSDVPVHVFLSGGIDSTLVASQCEGMGAIHLDGPERTYAQQVADKFKLNLQVVNPKDFDPVEAMTDYVVKSGEPAMAALIPWMVSKEAAKLGKVAITANGADELFFGYNRTHDDTSMWSDQFYHIFRKQFLGEEWCNLGHIHSTDVYFAPGRWSELQYYVQFDLNQTLDRTSMCHSLEVRSPFLDHRLVEMALSIPEQVHRNGYGNKSILKKMLKSMGFNEQFFQRPKLGFSLFKQPVGLYKLYTDALTWAVEREFLKCNIKTLSGRDLRYLEASAFSFKIWYEHYEKILRS